MHDEEMKKEMSEFDAEFAAMMQESTSQAKQGNHDVNKQRKEIIIPVSQIKRKMPEIGKIQGPDIQTAANDTS